MVQPNNLAIIKDASKKNGCAQYGSPDHVKEMIDELGVFKDVEDIVAYTRVAYTDEYELTRGKFTERYLKEICASKAEGANTKIRALYFDGYATTNRSTKVSCVYPYFNTGSVGAINSMGPEDFFIEYKICTRMYSCLITASIVSLSSGETRNRPRDDRCVFSIYAPARKL
ncbi:hypothetical protein AX774_g7101 [Zancudomyces culisetae]|uniref:Uncharacterized protein n=1 Tax=Zancudomyces culisetae TaxID=1213189 RepID=A0A1R1PEU7_ZANCU|nr:hypothetical protein AX774_g7101 [Zancudomyces culisetae]|eukprot:OMH79487.1 hypothetical protein AX774_g7101 [Zancudomyces culisetae]